MLTKNLILMMISMLISGSLCRRSFTINYNENTFMKDGKPFRYISGEIHYFRVPEIYWRDRLQKIRKAGLNAIQTYVPWNYHEMFQGEYDFKEKLNIVNFIKLAQEEDLLVILRPGPYICAEWEFGGLPYWLLKDSPDTIRTNDTRYLIKVDKWFSVLLPMLRPYLYSNGGPVIAAQVENEYGSYGCNHDYMVKMQAIVEKYLGTDVVLFTTDGARDGFLKCGAIPSLYTTVDFGPGGDIDGFFKVQRKYQPSGPLVNSEYYTGWFDHWGEKHHTVDAEVVARDLDKILAMGANVNMYMFEGGTNFDLMNGANSGYAPVTTSYNYDGPLSEAGDPNEKYAAIQKVISKYVEIPPGPQPEPTPKKAYGKFYIDTVWSFYLFLPHIKNFTAKSPLSFEDVDLATGYILYRTDITGMLKQINLTLNIDKFHDRAVVMVDKKFQGVLDRNHNKSINIVPGRILDIFVENEGRIGYGHEMTDNYKGILSNVTLNGEILSEWTMCPCGTHEQQFFKRQFMNVETIDNDEVKELPKHPFFAHFIFPVEKAEDTFLKLEHWSKGLAAVNGKFLQKYWTTAGPQKTLFIPKSALIENSTRNLVSIFETERPSRHASMENVYIEFVDSPEFD